MSYRESICPKGKSGAHVGGGGTGGSRHVGAASPRAPAFGAAAAPPPPPRHGGPPPPALPAPPRPPRVPRRRRSRRPGAEPPPGAPLRGASARWREFVYKRGRCPGPCARARLAGGVVKLSEGGRANVAGMAAFKSAPVSAEFAFSPVGAFLAAGTSAAAIDSTFSTSGSLNVRRSSCWGPSFAVKLSTACHPSRCQSAQCFIVLFTSLPVQVYSLNYADGKPELQLAGAPVTVPERFYRLAWSRLGAGSEEQKVNQAWNEVAEAVNAGIS